VFRRAIGGQKESTHDSKRIRAFRLRPLLRTGRFRDGRSGEHADHRLRRNTHIVNVRWDGTLTGFGALELVAAQATDGRLDYLSFSFGKFVTGLGVGGDYQYGEGELWPIENYWHYWTAEGDAAFEAAMFGAADRALQDGSRDAWVFGSSAAPAAIPAPGALALAACAGLSRRRRA
jgi:hypothetical protein